MGSSGESDQYVKLVEEALTCLGALPVEAIQGLLFEAIQGLLFEVTQARLFEAMQVRLFEATQVEHRDEPKTWQFYFWLTAVHRQQSCR